MKYIDVQSENITVQDKKTYDVNMIKRRIIVWQKKGERAWKKQLYKRERRMERERNIKKEKTI